MQDKPYLVNYQLCNGSDHHGESGCIFLYFSDYTVRALKFNPASGEWESKPDIADWRARNWRLDANVSSVEDEMRKRFADKQRATDEKQDGARTVPDYEDQEMRRRGCCDGECTDMQHVPFCL